MKYCPKCQFRIAENHNLCLKCGFDVSYVDGDLSEISKANEVLKALYRKQFNKSLKSTAIALICFIIVFLISILFVENSNSISKGADLFISNAVGFSLLVFLIGFFISLVKLIRWLIK